MAMSDRAHCWNLGKCWETELGEDLAELHKTMSSWRRPYPQSVKKPAGSWSACLLHLESQKCPSSISSPNCSRVLVVVGFDEVSLAGSMPCVQQCHYEH